MNDETVTINLTLAEYTSLGEGLKGEIERLAKEKTALIIKLDEKRNLLDRIKHILVGMVIKQEPELPVQPEPRKRSPREGRKPYSMYRESIRKILRESDSPLTIKQIKENFIKDGHEYNGKRKLFDALTIDIATMARLQKEIKYVFEDGVRKYYIGEIR